MKRNHRIPALALALSMAASLAACSGGTPAETGTTAPQTSAPVQTGTADTDINDLVRFGHTMECTCHKGIVIRCITEHN